MREALIILACVAAVAALEGARQLLRWSAERRRDELRRRLDAIVRQEAGASLLRDRRLSAHPTLDAALRAIPFAHGLAKLLEQADSRRTVAQLAGGSALAGVAGLVGASLLGLGTPIAVLAGAVGLLVPAAVLRAQRDRRSRKLSEQLPEALDMMARSLRAGHALTSAFEVVASEMAEPVAVEFGRAFESQRLGLPVEQAIVEMTERTPGNRDLEIFAVSAVIQRETGGNLAELLGSIAETIRARYRFYGKLRVLTAEGRASGLVLGALPLLMLVLLRIVNPEYLEPLFLTPSGHAVLAAAAGSWLAGLTWLYRLTRVDL
jgi:tight adherence protein B